MLFNPFAFREKVCRKTTEKVKISKEDLSLVKEILETEIKKEKKGIRN